MTMTDPVADMLTRLRNANSAYHDTVSMPYSKLKARIAEILKAGGYIADWSEEPARVGKTLALELKFGPPGAPRCSVASASRSSPRPPGCSLTSRPARRAWAGKSSRTSGNR